MANFRTTSEFPAGAANDLPAAMSHFRHIMRQLMAAVSN
jgi:hypothetical protein